MITNSVDCLHNEQLHIHGNVVTLFSKPTRKYSYETEAIKTAIRAKFDGKLYTCVFCDTVCFIYGDDGQDFLINIPFQVEKAVSLPDGGMLIQRYTRINHEKGIPVFFSLLDPYMIFGTVHDGKSGEFFGMDQQFLFVEGNILITTMNYQILLYSYKINQGSEDSLLNCAKSRSKDASLARSSQIISKNENFFVLDRNTAIADFNVNTAATDLNINYSNKFNYNSLRKEITTDLIQTIKFYEANDLEVFYVYDFFCIYSKTKSKIISLLIYQSNDRIELLDYNIFDALGACCVKCRMFQVIFILRPNGHLSLLAPLIQDIIIDDRKFQSISVSQQNCLQLLGIDGTEYSYKFGMDDSDDIVPLVFQCLKTVLPAALHCRLLIGYLIIFMQKQTSFQSPKIRLMIIVFSAFFTFHEFCCDLVTSFGINPSDLTCTRNILNLKQIDEKGKYLASMHLALHLLYEDLKLDTSKTEDFFYIQTILLFTSRILQWKDFSYEYSLNDPNENCSIDYVTDTTTIVLREPNCQQFSILSWAISIINCPSDSPVFPNLNNIETDFPYIKQCSEDQDDEILLKNTSMIIKIYKLIFCKDLSTYERLQKIYRSGLDLEKLYSLPIGISCAIYELIANIQCNPPTDWEAGLLKFIDRTDICSSIYATPHEAELIHISSLATNHQLLQSLKAKEPKKIPESQLLNKEIVFRSDRRIREVEKMLDFTEQITTKDLNFEYLTEHQTITLQQDLGRRVSLRTMSCSIGYGLLAYDTSIADFTKPLSMPKFLFSIKISPSKTIIKTDPASLDSNLLEWCKFHVGCSTALTIGRSVSTLSGSWITYNSPETLNSEHAGFLLGLGLNGYLENLATWNAFNYLVSKHIMTSIAVLIGMSVSYLGTMNSMVTRLLSVHIPALLPKGSSELNLSPLTQIAGLIGIGFLYCQTEHRMMSEITFRQLNLSYRIVGIDSEYLAMYRVAAGFSLGLINLCKGPMLRGMRDLALIQSLIYCISGISIGANVEAETAATGAIIALTIMFLQTNNKDVACRISAPSNAALLDYIRPDILILRVIAESLIMWSDIEPSLEWIMKKLPPEWRSQPFIKSKFDSCDINLYLMIASSCYSIALRYTGTANEKAMNLCLEFLDKFVLLSSEPVNDYDERTCFKAVMQSINMLILSLSILTAGSGNLDILRRIRKLHGRITADMEFGDHCAIHAALGLLFLGKGRYSLSRTPLAITCLFCAFFPSFPASSGTNAVNLEALRHLWVLAIEHRNLITMDESSRSIKIATAKIAFEDRIQRIESPCWLPPPQQIKWIMFDDIKLPIKLDMKSESHKNIITRGNPIYLHSDIKNQSKGALADFIQKSKLLCLADPSQQTRNLALSTSKMDCLRLESMLYLSNAMKNWTTRDRLLEARLVLDYYDSLEYKIQNQTSRFLSKAFIEALQVYKWSF